VLALLHLNGLFGEGVRRRGVCWEGTRGNQKYSWNTKHALD